jgi:hypothetical protein
LVVPKSIPIILPMFFSCNLNKGWGLGSAPVWF